MGRTAKDKIAILINRDVHVLLSEVAKEKEFSITEFASIILDDWFREYYKENPSMSFEAYVKEKKDEYLI